MALISMGKARRSKFERSIARKIKITSWESIANASSRGSIPSRYSLVQNLEGPLTCDCTDEINLNEIRRANMSHYLQEPS